MAEPSAPDLVQAVLGYRTWAVDDEGWLLPFSLGAIAGPWRPGTNRATCHYAKWRGPAGGAPGGLARGSHAAPDPRCMCGVYPLADPHEPRLPHDAPTQALGAIGAWGDLEVHRDGFRAEYATVLALAVAPGAPPSLRRRHERAAERYGVELVAPAVLEVTGLRYAAPLPPELLPGGPGLAEAPGPRRPARPRGRAARRGAPTAGRVAAPAVPAGRGVRLEEHVWLDAATLRCGITAPFARELGPGPVDLTLPAVGTLHRTSDALAHVTGAAGETLRVWPPLTGTIRTVNPALADDPGLLLRDPEGAGWLATLAPTAWGEEAGRLEWGPRGAHAYRHALAGPDPWAELRGTAVHVRSAQEVLAELRRRRALPRFPDAAAVERELVAPLRAALAGDPDAAAALGRLGRRVRFVLTAPDAAFALDARRAPARVVPGGDPQVGDVTLTLPAVEAERLLGGALDVPQALRAGLLRSDSAPGPTLAVASVLSSLPRIPSRSRNRRPMRT